MKQRKRIYSKTIALQVSMIEAWSLLWQPECCSVWMGNDITVNLQEGGQVQYFIDGVPWRKGAVRSISKPHLVVVDMECTERSRSKVTVTVEEKEKKKTVVHISEANIPIHLYSSVEVYWDLLLARFVRTVRTVEERRKNPRQAVVLIHGIGEQQPGEMLRGFLDSGVLGNDIGTDIWIKPDRMSDLFELRRATISGSDKRPITEVYECYWAHIIRDTTPEQLYSWISRLLFRKSIPQALKFIWACSWVVILAGLASSILLLLAREEAKWVFLPVLLAGLALASKYLIGSIGINIIGDAARYLQPKPSNIAHRQAIRMAGVNLIDKLHQSGRFDRIVIVGHSLGSVIAYDLIVHSWLRLHRRHMKPEKIGFKAFLNLVGSIGKMPLSGSDAQKLQAQAWRQLRLNTQPWLITDLITLGSPLTYADFLIENNRTEFTRAVQDRVIPVAPPLCEMTTKERTTLLIPSSSMEGSSIYATRSNLSVLHHAAPFAVTRWTNLYFKTNWNGLKGDLIGGPLATLFGSWVKDVPLSPIGGRFNHTSYWFKDSNSKHLQALSESLQMDAKKDLISLLQCLPPSLFLQNNKVR
jgi:hypothetical protein